MFRLHETMRRRVGRTAFVLLCVAPSLATIAWIAYARRPWRVRDEQARLSGVLRVEARLADWREPRPGTVRTTGLTLMAAGSDVTGIELANVELRRVGGVGTLSAGAITIDARRFDALARLANTWIDVLAEQSLQLQTDELAFTDGRIDGRFVVRDVQLRVDRDADGASHVQVTAQVANGTTESASLRVLVDRFTVDSQPVVRAKIDASGAAIPAWLLAAAAPLLRSVGETATFQGVVQLDFRDGALRGAAQGQLHGASLAAMLPMGSPCQAEGEATITLTDLRWQGQQLELLSGSMHAANTRVNRPLLAAAANHLFCGVAPMSSGAAAEMVAVDRLACRFQFDAQGLTLWGDFAADENLPAGCLATSGGNVLVTQPQHVRLPAGYWVQFVAGPSANWMPATREALGVAELLPLPHAVEQMK